MSSHREKGADNISETISLEELKLPQTKEELQVMLDGARKEGAVLAMRALTNEFSQPLTAVIGYADILIAKSSESAPHSLIQEIAQAGQNLSRLIDKFRGLAKSRQFIFSTQHGLPTIEPAPEEKISS